MSNVRVMERNSRADGGLERWSEEGWCRPWLEFSVSGGTCFGRKTENEESTAGFVFESKFYRLSPAESSSTFCLCIIFFFFFVVSSLNGSSLVAQKRCKRKLKWRCQGKDLEFLRAQGEWFRKFFFSLLSLTVT